MCSLVNCQFRYTHIKHTHTHEHIHIQHMYIDTHTHTLKCYPYAVEANGNFGSDMKKKKFLGVF